MKRTKRKPPDRVLTSFYIDRATLAAIKGAAKRADVSLAHALRHGARLWLTSMKKEGHA